MFSPSKCTSSSDQRTLSLPHIIMWPRITHRTYRSVWLTNWFTKWRTVTVWTTKISHSLCVWDWYGLVTAKSFQVVVVFECFLTEATDIFFFWTSCLGEQSRSLQSSWAGRQDLGTGSSTAYSKLVIILILLHLIVCSSSVGWRLLSLNRQGEKN